MFVTKNCRGRVAIDSRRFEVDKVFDARLDKDDEVFQEVSHDSIPC